MKKLVKRIHALTREHGMPLILASTLFTPDRHRGKFA
jgi:hypothetical protein